MTTPLLRYIEITGASTRVEAVITGDYLMKTGPVTEARGILRKDQLWTFGEEVIRKAGGFKPKYVLIFAADTGILWSITWSGFAIFSEHVPNSPKHQYGEQWGVHVDQWERLDPRFPQDNTPAMAGRPTKVLHLPDQYNKDQLVIEPPDFQGYKLLRVGIKGPRGGYHGVVLGPAAQDTYYKYHR